MIILQSTDTLQIVLAAIKTSFDMDVVVSYRDITATGYTPARLLTNSNGTSDVNILTAPAPDHQYVIDFISVFNKDTVLHNVILKYDVSGVEKIIYQGDIASKGELTYNDGKGWDYISPNPQGFAINVQALTSSPPDTTPFYFGTKPAAITTTAGLNKTYIRRACTLKIAELYTYSGTAGTGEAVSVYVRVNNTTDYLIQTVSLATNERIFSNPSMSIPFAAGDYFEIKVVPPVWVTNPLTFIAGGYLYFE